MFYEVILLFLVIGSAVSFSVTWQVIPSSEKMPSARFDAAYSWSKDNGYIFGGATSVRGAISNELFVYQFETQQWRRFLPTSTISARRDAAAFYDSNSNRFVFSGGFASSAILSSTFSVNSTDFSAEEINYQPAQLLERAGHNMLSMQPFFVSFGGKTHQGCTNDIIIGYQKPYSLSQFNYNHSSIAPRMWSSIAVLPNSYQLLVWGGYNCNQERALNDAWIINLENGSVMPLAQKNQGPPPRSGHQIFIKGDYLIVFGGENEQGDGTSDLFVYQFSTQLWNQVQDSNPIKGRLGAVCFPIDTNSSTNVLEFIVFGGISGWNRDVQILNDQYRATIEF